MSTSHPNPNHSREQLAALLDDWLEVELSHRRIDGLLNELLALPGADCEFLLDWTRRVASVHRELGWQFGKRAPKLLASMGRRQLQAWAVVCCDSYDRIGLRAALQAVEQVESFSERQLQLSAGVMFEDLAGVLGNFVRGLSGRRLTIVQGEAIYTDGEQLFLPAVIARLPVSADNFQLAKAAVALLWAQTRHGSFRADLAAACAGFPDPARALRQLSGLESLRLSARLASELPGLYREMQRLRAALGEGLNDDWQALAAQLADPASGIDTSLALLAQAYALSDFTPWCFQGELRPEAVAAAFAARREKEKARLRVKLSELLNADVIKQQALNPDETPRFEVQPHDEEGHLDMELTLNDQPVAPPDDVKALLSSIYLDFGEIPPDYLVPAGDGEYDPSLLGLTSADPDAVWQGTYHEIGAELYPEWDAGRQHYRKNWAVMREKEVTPVFDGFPAATLEKYAGLVRHLHKAFEAMRDENRLEKRQSQGDDIDLDALVEALADAHDGREMSERLFTRQHRAERNIAVAFMVDMSGSTKGWINECEREALLLLCEALEKLGDRYAIYGFSGTTRKRCELFRIKTFAEGYTSEVKARISGIRAQEYTRMGFAIRHLSKLLKAVEAKTRVLVTLSDGRPDDYFDGYRGPYGIEDTRMALAEARRSGIHLFCITIDREARDYLPHMYGAARYVVLDDVRQLPMKVADIYRRITT